MHTEIFHPLTVLIQKGNPQYQTEHKKDLFSAQENDLNARPQLHHL